MKENYKEKGERQNMEAERAKAIDILELVEEKTGTNIEGDTWFDLEDAITRIIKEK